MRVAIAGSGSFAKYFAEELPAAGFEVVVLTRSHKSFFDGKHGVLEQRITDYESVSALAELLNDCDALVSTVSMTTQIYADVHLNLIQACKQTSKCKRFIPSEFGGNSEKFPEQPGSTYQYNAVVKDALKAQNELEWTVISLGWLMDYVVPSANRYHADLSPLFALDLRTETMTIPGMGHEPFSITSARDVAKAVAQMLKSKSKWRPFTYVQGQETTWLKIADAVKTHGGLLDLKIEFESVDELAKVLEHSESTEEALVAEFKLYAPTGKLTFDQSKVQRDRTEFFPDLRLYSVAEALEAVKKEPSMTF